MASGHSEGNDANQSPYAMVPEIWEEFYDAQGVLSHNLIGQPLPPGGSYLPRGAPPPPNQQTGQQQAAFGQCYGPPGNVQQQIPMQQQQQQQQQPGFQSSRQQAPYKYQLPLYPLPSRVRPYLGPKYQSAPVNPPQFPPVFQPQQPSQTPLLQQQFQQLNLQDQAAQCLQPSQFQQPHQPEFGTRPLRFKAAPTSQPNAPQSAQGSGVFLSNTSKTEGRQPLKKIIPVTPASEQVTEQANYYPDVAFSANQNQPGGVGYVPKDQVAQSRTHPTQGKSHMSHVPIVSAFGQYQYPSSQFAPGTKIDQSTTLQVQHPKKPKKLFQEPPGSYWNDSSEEEEKYPMGQIPVQKSKQRGGKRRQQQQYQQQYQQQPRAPAENVPRPPLMLPTDAELEVMTGVKIGGDPSKAGIRSIGYHPYASAATAGQSDNPPPADGDDDDEDPYDEDEDQDDLGPDAPEDDAGLFFPQSENVRECAQQPTTSSARSPPREGSPGSRGAQKCPSPSREGFSSQQASRSTSPIRGVSPVRSFSPCASQPASPTRETSPTRRCPPPSPPHVSPNQGGFCAQPTNSTYPPSTGSRSPSPTRSIPPTHCCSPASSQSPSQNRNTSPARTTGGNIF